MRKLLCLLVFATISCAFVSAENFTLTGTVRDRATNSYLPGVKLVVYDEKGDSVGGAEAWSYDYRRGMNSMMREKSDFSVEVPRREGVYTLQFSFADFDTLRVNYPLTGLGRREQRRPIGIYYMDRHREPVTLKEVTVEASKVKFYHKGDTIVFNADAFNLAEGSMLDALIK